MPETAFRHFEEDMERAETILRHAHALERARRKQALHRDLRFSALAMAVGAMDAYFCDAYVDCFTSALKAYSAGKWPGRLPAAYAKQKLPAGVVLDTSRKRRPRWAFRMAARAIMERDNMLAISRIPEEFNGILPSGQKLWACIADDLAWWGARRFTKYTYPELVRATGTRYSKVRKEIAANAMRRIAESVQIRHDWAHNCGRPKNAISRISYGQANARINEIGWLVSCFNDHIEQHRLA